MQNFLFKSSIRLISRRNTFIIIHLITTTHSHSAYLITSLYNFLNSSIFHTFLCQVTATHSSLDAWASYTKSHSKYVTFYSKSYSKNKTFYSKSQNKDNASHTRSHNKYKAFSSHRIQKITISFNSCQILCIYKSHAFGKHNSSYNLRFQWKYL